MISVMRLFHLHLPCMHPFSELRESSFNQQSNIFLFFSTINLQTEMCVTINVPNELQFQRLQQKGLQNKCIHIPNSQICRQIHLIFASQLSLIVSRAYYKFNISFCQNSSNNVNVRSLNQLNFIIFVFRNFCLNSICLNFELKSKEIVQTYQRHVNCANS